MEQDSSNNHKISPIHRKALDIFTLSSQISRYILPDLAKLQSNGFEDPNIYFTGDIIQQSNSLVPEIVEAERKSFSEERQEHLLSISRLTSVIDKNCERLESINHAIDNDLCSYCLNAYGFSIFTYIRFFDRL